MPTYEYVCKQCGHLFEIVQSMRDDPLTECPECGGELRKIFAPPAISFKGSGFYATDQRKKATTPSGDKGDTAESGNKGDKGDKGDKGEKGERGERGDSKKKAASGPKKDSRSDTADGPKASSGSSSGKEGSGS